MFFASQQYAEEQILALHRNPVPVIKQLATRLLSGIYFGTADPASFWGLETFHVFETLPYGMSGMQSKNIHLCRLTRTIARTVLNCRCFYCPKQHA